MDWRFDVPITEDSVKSFLFYNGVQISVTQKNITKVQTDNIFLEMAPIQEKDKEKKKLPRLSPNVIRQYSREGHFIAEFDSISEAVSASNISEKSIRNAVYGYRKSGGGFIWKQVTRGSLIEDVQPIVQIENTGVGRAILQLDTSGNIVSEYPSKRAATAATGINARSISDALDGVQKTAGGFEWKYKEESTAL